MTHAKALIRWHKKTAFPRKTTSDNSRVSSESSRVTFAQAKRLLLSELGKLGTLNADVYVNLPADCFSQSGYGFRAKAVKYAFPGVYVVAHFQRSNLILCCDRHRRWQRNLYSIAAGIRSLRSLTKSGVAPLGEQFGPFMRAKDDEPPPRPGNSHENVGSVATLSGAAKYLAQFSDFDAAVIVRSAETAKSAYRQAARKCHPDAGGDQSKFERLTKAWETLRRHHRI